MRPLKTYAPLILLCATAGVARLIVGAHISDDAYITMRYSRNLRSAGAMSYNPPDPVLGTSTPLWTWVLAAGQMTGASPEKTAVAAASLADIGSMALILTSPAAGSIAAIVAAATIAAWPAYVMHAVSGMETSLYVLTVVAFVTAMSRAQPGVAAVAAALGALCRPDGALLAALGFVWTLAGHSRAAALRFAATVALIGAPWTIFAFARFGSVIPSSVTAKASAVDPWFLSFENLAAYFLRGFYLPVTLLAFGGFAVIAAGFMTRARDDDRGTFLWRLWSVWALGYLAGMTAANAFTHFPWYFAPLLPIYTASAALAIETAASRAGHVPAVLRSAALRASLAAVLGAALLTRMPALKSYLEASAAGREDLYASVATQLAGVDARCTVAATEIGTIGYHYPGRILDLVGLVSPEVVGRPLDAVLAESRARWLVTYDTHFDRAVAGSEPFASRFERRSFVRISDARGLEVYERRDRLGCGTP
jgi:hypothetical protein